MNNKKCRVGIVGAGRIGTLHAENIVHHLPQYDLQAIADPNLNKEWANGLSIAKVSTNEEDILFHPNLDAVIIASPSHLHLEHIKAASESGK